MRFSEKLLERAGISVETIDLSEIFGRARQIDDGDPVTFCRVSTDDFKDGSAPT